MTAQRFYRRRSAREGPSSRLRAPCRWVEFGMGICTNRGSLVHLPPRPAPHGSGLIDIFFFCYTGSDAEQRRGFEALLAARHGTGPAVQHRRGSRSGAPCGRLQYARLEPFFPLRLKAANLFASWHIVFSWRGSEGQRRGERPQGGGRLAAGRNTAARLLGALSAPHHVELVAACAFWEGGKRLEASARARWGKA